jgi:hypothetical protein
MLLDFQYEPGTSGPKTGEGECLMHKTLKLGEMEGYGRTFSSYHNWMAAHPEVKARNDGGLFSLSFFYPAFGMRE